MCYCQDNTPPRSANYSRIFAEREPNSCGVVLIIRLKSCLWQIPCIGVYTATSYATSVIVCDNCSGYGYARCNNYNDACPGLNNGNYNPNNVWSSTPRGSNYYNRNLNNGSFNENYNNSRNAFSGRCVLVFGSRRVFIWQMYLRLEFLKRGI